VSTVERSDRTIAVVLAAGVNRRMGTRTPKSLLTLDENGQTTTFLQRHVDLLQKEATDRVVVVVSQQGAELDEIQGLRGAELVVSPFDTGLSGSTLSMLCALRRLAVDDTAGLLISDADIVYERRLLRWIVENRGPSSLFVTPRVAGDEEEVLVYGPNPGKPHLIGKGLPPELRADLQLFGESLGIIYIAPEDRGFVFAMSQWLAGWPPEVTGYGYSKQMSEHEEVWQYAFTRGRMNAMVVPEDLMLAECDTPDDYRYIVDELFPLILGRDDALAGADDR
jgi:choline kinase